MKKYMLLILTPLLCIGHHYALFTSLTPLHLRNFPWSNIRNSSVTANSELYLQYESIYLEESEHIVYYLLESEWQHTLCENLSANTFQSVVPFTNTESLYLSFRITDDDDTYIIPGFTTELNPSFQQMIPLSEYPRNTDIPDHLNISGEKMAFSEERLYFALSNFGSGFPASGGLFGPFYSYTINLWHPADEPEYVYTLLYTVSFPPFISPGLYKIEAATDEMTQIGSVSFQFDDNNNTLYLSCLIQDLMNDDDFAGTFSPEEPLVISSLTQKIEDLGQTITIMDEGNPHYVFLRELLIEPFTNSIPEIDNIHVEQENDTIIITLDYFDFEGHFPIISEILLDTGIGFQFHPASNDFTETVTFTCQFAGEWSSGTIRFSDNGTDIVEHPLFNSCQTNTMVSPNLSLNLYPNPFIHTMHSSRNLSLEAGQYTSVDIRLFNLKGQMLLEMRALPVIEDSFKIPAELLELNLRSSGIYFLRATMKNQDSGIQRNGIEKFLYIR